MKKISNKKFLKKKRKKQIQFNLKKGGGVICEIAKHIASKYNLVERTPKASLSISHMLSLNTL
jgi:hypothetical protein